MCDNKAVVDMINSVTFKSDSVAVLLRNLSQDGNIIIKYSHIPGA